MKQIVAFILLAVLVFSLFGCGPSKSTATANFYYCTVSPEYHTQSSVIQAEQRKININLSDLEGVLQLYLEGPASGKLYSPFPSGTTLITVHNSKDVTSVILSDDISRLSGVELMLACACLASTIMEISQSEAVQIRAETAFLNNQEFIEFTSQSLLSFS